MSHNMFETIRNTPAASSAASFPAALDSACQQWNTKPSLNRPKERVQTPIPGPTAIHYVKGSRKLFGELRKSDVDHTGGAGGLIGRSPLPSCLQCLR